MMELRRLRLIHELARRGTIAAVAEALAYSPSSVSVQLAELEREAGVKLLRRVGRNVALTAAGWRLAEHAEAALTHDEAIRAELAMLGAGPRGLVRLTFVQSPALALLSATLARLAEVAPDVRAEVVQQETAPAIEALRSRAVDLVVGIEYDPVPVPRHRDVDRRDLIREEVLLAVPLGSAAHDARRRRARAMGRRPARQRPGRRGRERLQPPRRLRARLPPPLGRRPDPARAGLLGPGRDAAPGADRHRDARCRHPPHPGLYRTIFTAARAAAADAPAVVAVREAIDTAAHAAALGRDDIRLV